MENSKLTALLGTFTKIEFEEFGDFVRSHFHNKLQMVTKFFEVLEKHYPLFKDEALKKENVFRALYGKGTYKDELIRKLIYHLMNLAEEYLAYKNFISNEIIPKTYLLNELNNRNQYKLFEKNFKSASEILSINKAGNRFETDYFYNCYILENELSEYYNKKVSVENFNENNLKSGEYLILLFLKRISVIIYNSFCYTNSFKSGNDLNLAFELTKNLNLDGLIEKAGKNNYGFNYHIEIYYYIIKLFTAPEKEHFFFKLRKLVTANYMHFSQFDLYNLYTSLTSYCVYKKITGNLKFPEEEFKLYEDILKHNCFTFQEKGYMPTLLFKNIVFNSLELNKIEWAEKFVNQYSEKLMPECRESLMYHALAEISFDKKEYMKTLQFASKVNIDDFFTKFTIKYLVITTYYELEEYEAALDAIDSFGHFLDKNKKVTKDRRSVYAVKINFLKRLILIKTSGSQNSGFETKRLRDEINKSSGNFAKSWLLEKLDVLEKTK